MRILILIFLLLFNFLFAIEGLYDKSHIPYKIHLYKKDAVKMCNYYFYYAMRGRYVDNDWLDKFGSKGYLGRNTAFLKHFVKCNGWEGYEVWIIDSECPKGAYFNFSSNQCNCPPNSYLDENTNKCVPAHCAENLKCAVGMSIDYRQCQCKCPAPMVTGPLGCIPDTNLDKKTCEKVGGVYMTNSISDTFENVENGIASLYAPPGEHYCYSKSWAEAIKNAWEAKFNVKEVILSTLSLTPIAKLSRLAKWIGLGDKIIEEAKSPKNLLQNKYIIDTKYNPETGTFEPIIEADPRSQELSPQLLFEKPTTQDQANKIISSTGALRKFLESDLMNDISITSDSELTQAGIAYDLEESTKTGENTKIMDDLRELFKRSSPKNEDNLPIPVEKSPAPTSGRKFPAVIKDHINQEGDTIPVIVNRKEIKPVSITNNYKTYNVTYYITPQGASKPLVVKYEVKVNKDNSITAKPRYELGKTTHVGTLTIINYSKDKKNNNDEKNKNNLQNSEDTQDNNASKKNDVNVKDALLPTENAIKKALNYKVVLFSCPSVTPKCPNDINITMQGHNIAIPDITCSVIKAIDNKYISPKVDLAGNLIVLFAGLVGLLSLFRRT